VFHVGLVYDDYSLWFGRIQTAMLVRMDEADWLRTEFGDLLRTLREERQLSQAQLALESEVDQTFVSLLERGRRQPTLGTLFALCDALRIEPDVVVGKLVAARKHAKRRA
jgi:DNA-binding XRE family transcriptional regulator